MNTNRLKVAAASSVLSAVLFLTGAPLVRAEENRARCQHHIEQAEAKLSRAVSRHGERSPQARSARQHLNEERQECWSRHHAWYNMQERRWHTEQDWDRDDHR